MSGIFTWLTINVTLEHQQHLEFARDVLKEAGKMYTEIDPGRFRHYPLEEKAESEKDVDDYIRKRIMESDFNYSVLSEEGTDYLVSGEYAWIVDPLDGTGHFNLGSPTFSISMALRKKLSMVMGAVYNPYNNDMHFALDGQAFSENERFKKYERGKIGYPEKLEEATISVHGPQYMDEMPFITTDLSRWFPLSISFEFFPLPLTKVSGLRKNSKSRKIQVPAGCVLTAEREENHDLRKQRSRGTGIRG